MHNRDFLLGGAAQAAACNCWPPRPGLWQQRWLSTHGDALCLDDFDYLQFRTQVRSPAWQRPLAPPPARAIAHAPARQSRRAKKSAVYADVDAAAARTGAGRQ
jgi:UDP-2,3-diacylglucosamine hydrolase